MSQGKSISRAELEIVKATISRAENGKATLAELAKAHEICERAGAQNTAGIIRGHYVGGAVVSSGMKNTLRGVGIGVISGTIVWFLLGRQR